MYNQPMQNDFVESLLRSGILAAQAGQRGLARRRLERAIPDRLKDIRED